MSLRGRGWGREGAAWEMNRAGCRTLRLKELKEDEDIEGMHVEKCLYLYIKSWCYYLAFCVFETISQKSHVNNYKACLCVCVCLFANTLTYYIGRDWYSSIISDIMISSYLTSSDLIWLVFKIISCNSDAHFHQSLVIDCLKSQKTYCSNPSQDHGLIKIQFWWSHMPLFLRCCGQAYYCLPTKFKPQVSVKDS